ncbi:phosphatase PAP2 family protein [Streptomyces abyssomicinicus]|uniref:phosphatase PAP2 family protein n=1 Tax=Streptomyces abyssomicinicus TaxID=574929 RepID=UPI001FEC0424|nr:phosphatase PAP2 family protein [Streptomyces abyssomicinicus]
MPITPPRPRPPFLRPALCLLGLLFAVVTWQVAAEGPLARADERLGRALLARDGVSAFLADLGNVEVALPVLAAAAGYAALRARAAGLRRWWAALVAAAGAAVAVPLVVAPLQALIDRPGPPPMAPDTGFYPSGHTATAVVFYGAAVLLVLPWLRRRVARLAAVGAGVVLVAATGVGLVRHGYHWPLDVVGSLTAGAAALTAPTALRTGKHSGS